MNKQETIKILVLLNGYYGNRFKYPKEDERKTEITENLWYKFLKKYPIEIVEAAVDRVMLTMDYSPTPKDIIQEINNMQADDEDRLTAEEAWLKVTDAISSIGYTYNPEKVKEAIPDKALRAAQVVGLSLIARKGQNNSYVMNSYIKAYNNLKKADKERQALSGNPKDETKKLTDKFKGTPKLEGEDNE